MHIEEMEEIWSVLQVGDKIILDYIPFRGSPLNTPCPLIGCYTLCSKPLIKGHIYTILEKPFASKFTVRVATGHPLYGACWVNLRYFSRVLGGDSLDVFEQERYIDIT
jgi:hypothetical protein